jgi:hypothetical protein
MYAGRQRYRVGGVEAVLVLEHHDPLPAGQVHKLEELVLHLLDHLLPAPSLFPFLSLTLTYHFIFSFSFFSFSIFFRWRC